MKSDVLVPSELGYTLPQENLESDAVVGGEGSLVYNGNISGFETGCGAPVMGCPASRLSMSPWVRWRSDAAASRSITWNGGTLARLATWKRSVMGGAYGCGFQRSAAETRTTRR